MKPVSDSSILLVLIGKQMEPIAAEMAQRAKHNNSKDLCQVNYKTQMDACNNKFVYDTKTILILQTQCSINATALVYILYDAADTKMFKIWLPVNGRDMIYPNDIWYKHI